MLFNINFFFLIGNICKYKLKLMPPPGKMLHPPVSHNVTPRLGQETLSIGWIWSLLSTEGCLWTIRFLSPKRFTPRSFPVWQRDPCGNDYLFCSMDGQFVTVRWQVCALPLIFPVHCTGFFRGVGGQGRKKFKDLMRNQFEQKFLTNRVNLPFCKLIFVISYLYDTT